MKTIKNILSERNIILLICINTLIIFISGFKLNHNAEQILSILDIAFTLFFIIELILKIGTEKYSFFKSNWNIFDTILIIISIPSIFSVFIDTADLSFLLIFRTLRVFKMFRFFRFIPNIDKLLIGFTNAIKSSVVILITFIIYIFITSLLSNYMFGYSQYFDNPLESLYSILKIMTMEDWFIFQEHLVEDMTPVKSLLTNLYFILILLSSGIFGVSLINSIFVESMVRHDNEQTSKKLDEINEKIDKLCR